MTIRYGIEGGSATMVSGEHYRTVAQQRVAAALHRCWCSVFIVDVAPQRDRDLMVHDLLRELQSAAWRGVDVRLLIGGSRRNLDIAQTAIAALDIASGLGIDARWLTASVVRGSHTKMVLTDDWSLVGSHNWSPGAFGGQVQHSSLVQSAALAARLARSLNASGGEHGAHERRTNHLERVGQRCFAAGVAVGGW